MNCTKCNAQLAEKVKFCKYCGTPVVVGAAPQASSPRGDEPRYIYSGAPLKESEPEPPAKKKRSSAPLIVVLFLLLVLAIAAVGMVYNDNYKTVLAAIGFVEASEPVTTEAETEPFSAVTTQTDQPTTTALELTEKTEPPTEAITTTAVPRTADTGEIPPTAYRVYFEDDHDHTLFIRVGPSTDFKDIGSIPARSIVVVTRIVDGWAYLTYNGITGWSSMDYLFKV